MTTVCCDHSVYIKENWDNLSLLDKIRLSSKFEDKQKYAKQLIDAGLALLDYNIRMYGEDERLRKTVDEFNQKYAIEYNL